MRLREKLLTSLLLMPLIGTSAVAKERANFDAFLASQEAKSLPVNELALQSRGAQVAHLEERLGVPTVLWNARAGEKASAFAGQRPESAARAHVQQLADVYRLGREDVSNAVVHSVHTAKHGPVVVRFTQKVDGIEVFRSALNVAMTQDNELVAITGYMAPREAVATRSRSAGTDFQLSAADAVSRAFADLTDTKLSARSLVGAGTQGEFSQFAFEPGVGTVLPHAMGTPARAKKVFFTLADGLEPAWYVELHVGTKGSNDADYFSYVVSAKDGSLLFRNNLTVEDSFTYKVWADPDSFIPNDGPHGNDATPHPTGTPNGYQAPFISPVSITLEDALPGQSDPWLPAGATQTTGNNVEAYADLAAPDGYQPETDLRANTTSPGVFDYTYDVTRSPASSMEQRKAAIAHLFYVNNFLHDWFYLSGFDEASGNAQASNYGRGGVEGDSLKAEAQDYGGRNNANMSTPADGARPRMQMYVFDGVPSLQVTAPAAVAGNYDAGSAGWGKTTYDITGEVVIPNPNAVTEGCSAFAAGAFTGKIVLLDRGTCAFTVKAMNAQNAGAVAVLIANNAPELPAPGLGGTDPAVTIAALGITQEAGNALRNEVKNNNSTITVTMKKSPDLDRDGTIDNAIVAHEWGHYMSNRLVGNANGLINNQGRAMGEGWADFTALLMTTREEDRNRAGNNQFQGVYAMAGYTQSGGANNGHYYGIRRLPYSTDTSKNNLSYRHFAIGNPLPNNHPVNSSTLNGLGNAQVHNGGEVWASMLWECYVSLLNAYPFQEAQDRMKAYLAAAYKLTPVAPTLLEARDAVLAAAAASDPADYQRFLSAFAKRGAGMGAKAADRNSTDHIGVVESFANGNNIEVSISLNDSSSGCDRDGVLDKGETGHLSVTVTNTGANALPVFNATVASTSTSATFVFPNGNTLVIPALQRGASATRTLQVGLTDITPGTEPRAGLTVTFDEPSLPASSKVAKYNNRVHYDEVIGGSTTEAFESQLSAWTSSPANRWAPVVERDANGTPSRYFHAANLAVLSDMVFVSPWLKVNATGDFVVTYKYRHGLEGTTGGTGVAAPFYDGVVLEVTTDGSTWDNVFTKYGVNPGYVALLAASDNPLQGVPAYAGVSTGFPAWVDATANFGTKLAGKDVRLRFRIASDSAASAYGFDLDNLVVTNTANGPFSQLVAETSDGGTCNRRPIADVGISPRSVAEFVTQGGSLVRSTVTLTGTASFDPDGQPLTYKWTQVSGPPVTLSDDTSATPTFTADVSRNTLFGFQLVVKDSMQEESLPKVSEIFVTNVNRQPVAVPAAPATIAERSVATVTLDGTGSTDADGETLTYAWKQTGGPAVTLSSATAAKPTFATPEVSEDTQLTFELVVHDGIQASAAKTVAVTVTNVDRAPTANAGEDREANARDTVTLSGSAADADGDAITYAWTVVDAPAGTTLELTGADTATPSFTAPNVSTAAPITLTFQLVASAKGVNSEPDTVTVTVKRANRRPVGTGPANFEEEEGTAITLDASTGFSDPDGDSLSYSWTQTGGPLVKLTGTNAAQLKFTTPEVSTDTLMNFVLVVTDATGDEAAPVQVTVKVLQVNKAPVAHPRKLSGAVSEALVTLDATTSTDPDGDALTYKWEQTQGPAVTLSSENAATITFAAPKVESSTRLQFQLTVTDPSGESSSETVEVLVLPDDEPASSCSSTGNSGGSVMLLALLAGVLLSRRKGVLGA